MKCLQEVGEIQKLIKTKENYTKQTMYLTSITICFHHHHPRATKQLNEIFQLTGKKTQGQV